MDSLIAGARALLGLDLTPAQIAAFQTYADELRAWNERFNLTAIIDPEGIQVKHFLDSLSLLPLLPADSPTNLGQATGRLIDVGTGAGFPGLPLKIMRPALRLTPVEATGKEVTFCRAVAARAMGGTLGEVDGLSITVAVVVSRPESVSAIDTSLTTAHQLADHVEAGAALEEPSAPILRHFRAGSARGTSLNLSWNRAR